MNGETAKRIAQLLERRENAKHVIAGEVIDGKIKVWGRCPYISSDGSHLWLIEKLKDGSPAIWRACDIRRLKRGLRPQVNKCEMWYHRSGVPDFVEDKRRGMEYFAEAMAWAQLQMKELKGRQS